MTSFAGWFIFGLIAWVVIKDILLPKITDTTRRRDAAIIAAVISVNLMSLLDAASTLFLVGNQYSKEWYPIMNALINYHPGLFVLVKLVITLGGTLVCLYYYERKKRARTIFNLTRRAYTVLMVYHCVLLTSVLV